jgi:hypothetical protein
VPSANERRIVELVLKAVGDTEVQRMTAELQKMRGAAVESASSLKALEEMGAKVGETFKDLGKELLAGFGAEQIVERIKGAVESMEQLALSAQKVGVSAKDLQQLNVAANLTGTNAESLNKALVILSKNMADLSGKAGPATKYLRDLGIEAGTPVSEAFAKLSAQFEKMPDGAQKTALAVQEFGKAGAQLIPMLNEAGPLLAEIAKQFGELGIALTDQDVKAAKDFADEMKLMSAAIAGVTEKIVAGMAPALTAIAASLIDSAKAGTDFHTVGEKIGDTLIDIAKYAAGAVAALENLRASLNDIIRAVNDAEKGFAASLRFQPEQAESYYQAASSFAEAASSRFNATADVATAASNRVVAAYAKAKGAAAEGLGTGGTEGGDVDLSTLGKTPKAKKVKTPVDTTYRDYMKQLTEALKLYENATEDSVKVTINQIDAWNKAADTLNNAADPLRQYLADSAKLVELKKNSNLTDQAFALEMKNLNQRYDDQTQKLYENSDAYKANQLAIQQHADALQKLKDTWGFVADAAGEATQSIIEHTESLGTAVRRMVATIISQLAKLALEKFATQLLSGLFPTGPSQVNFGSLSDAAANVKIPGLAAGGVIGAPTMFAAGGGIGIAGEAGPEMIAPLRRDSSGNMGVGAVAPKVVVNNYAGADVGVTQTPQGVQIDVMRRQIADDIRRGGNPVSAALEGTYKVGRYAGAYG